MAVTTGHDSCDATPKAGGTSDARSSRWTAVFEQRGTEWLIAYETWEDIDGN